MEQQLGMHDHWMKLLFAACVSWTKKEVVQLFLSSLSSGDTAHRAVLPVYAIMQSFPQHTLLRQGQRLVRNSPCAVCSSPHGYPEAITDNDEQMIRLSMATGGIRIHGVYDYYNYLKQASSFVAIPEVHEKDVVIISAILNILKEVGDEETLKKEVLKRIGQITGFKSNNEQRQAILETLGYCSILETPTHRGLLNQYTNLSVAPRKNRSSDWKYPSDWWQGKDGINEQALGFWFGDFI